ncbi:MAG TPA: hypothetical protein VFN89_12895 [Solirubrobacterales bacterium]|nr:hypothetical protein [Solirubrobacterales bacterium]
MSEIAPHYSSAPIACNLSAGDLQERLATVADVGARFLLAREQENGRHLLRFRADPEARRRLEEIVAAESECCSFLDLSLGEDKGEILLSIASPAEGQAIADGLADSFVAPSPVDRSTSRRKRLGVLAGAGGLALAACCLVMPIVFGVALGAGLGGGIDAIAVALIVTGVAILVHRRRRTGSGAPCC